MLKWAQFCVAWIDIKLQMLPLLLVNDTHGRITWGLTVTEAGPILMAALLESHCCATRTDRPNIVKDITDTGNRVKFSCNSFVRWDVDLIFSLHLQVLHDLCYLVLPVCATIAKVRGSECWFLIFKKRKFCSTAIPTSQSVSGCPLWAAHSSNSINAKAA